MKGKGHVLHAIKFLPIGWRVTTQWQSQPKLFRGAKGLTQSRYCRW